jgi:hypothetical protein
MNRSQFMVNIVADYFAKVVIMDLRKKPGQCPDPVNCPLITVLSPLLRRLCGELQLPEDFIATDAPQVAEHRELLYRVWGGGVSGNQKVA